MRRTLLLLACALSACCKVPPRLTTPAPEPIVVEAPREPCLKTAPPPEAPVESREVDGGTLLTPAGEATLGANLAAVRRWMYAAWKDCGPRAPTSQPSPLPTDGEPGPLAVPGAP